MSDNKNVVLARPEAAPVLDSALVTLEGAISYESVMVSEEMRLAAHVAELRKSETVLQAALAEISRKRFALEARQRALGSASMQRTARYC